MCPAAHAALIDFLIFDWRETPGATTVAERAFPTTAFASDDRRTVAGATVSARPGLYRIDRVEPGIGFDAVPEFPPGPAIRITERAMSMSLRKGQFLPLRVFPAGPYHFVRLAGDPIAHGRDAAVLRALRRKALARDPAEFIAADPAAFHRIIREHGT